MQEKAAHRLLAQTLHAQMVEELHKNPALAADPDQQLQFKRLAQQQLLYQMAVAAQVCTHMQVVVAHSSMCIRNRLFVAASHVGIRAARRHLLPGQGLPASTRGRAPSSTILSSVHPPGSEVGHQILGTGMKEARGKSTLGTTILHSRRHTERITGEGEWVMPCAFIICAFMR